MLYHFSEEEEIEIFHPRKHSSFPERLPMVWAIDKERSALYFFPRDCPRIAYWATSNTTQQDRQFYFHTTTAKKVIAIEGSWLETIQNTRLYRYSFESEHFTTMDEGAGYFVSYETQIPVNVEPVGSLLQALTQEGVELRIMPSLTPLSEELLQTSLHFSMIRMRNRKK
ncbi:hypothetical protein KUV80_16725 [Fictibacillus nanhaiensis]|uniref:DUF6886 family protein n=1 Tax=Fictibacillus nanhaiensis TaxID=742169 RepID=UPI001C97F0A6|nr:DUF6886 family protein [Fictibacillus nanhaiensis]MBY6038293.1 hypothetical protein [Fictibacillus nanhaiensis]